MAFTTKLDFSNNRQVKQNIETNTSLSGTTIFGVPFSYLPVGPSTTSGVTASYSGVVSTFSGNSGTTIYTWYDNSMNIAVSILSALTPSNSATTQNTGYVFVSSSSATTVDGNHVNLSYSGVSFDITPISMYSLGGGNYSGTVHTNLFYQLSAGTIDYTGRTIWVDVSGITRTNELIVTKNPSIGYVLTCIDSEGRMALGPVSAATSSLWTAGTGTQNVVLTNSNPSSISGTNNLIAGYNSVVSGDYTYTEGLSTTTLANYTHAEGRLTTASGIQSHAEGYITVSSGLNSHAEGNLTSASGIATHAEGYGTKAIGNYSHSEGYGTSASGAYSHAQGINTIASGATSHAEGNVTRAIGQYSHAEGNDTTSNGISSHSEGDQTKSLGFGSHSEGAGTTAYGDYTHSEGNSTTAYGYSSHAEGYQTYSFGHDSHAEGYQTTAYNNAAHSEGWQTKAQGDSSHAEGYQTTASGVAGHSEGDGTIASGVNAHAEGSRTLASGNYSHAEGASCIATGNTSHAEGGNSYAYGDYSHAQGAGCITYGYGSHAGGYTSTAVGDYSFVHGTNSKANAANTIVLGQNITGNTANYTYVESLNIKTVGSSAFANDIRIDASGNLTTNTSDIRMKENISPLTNSLDKIKQLNGVKYQWKDRVAGGDDFKIGFIAQEVEEVEPLLVFTNKVDGYKGIHIDSVIPMLVEAVKELSNGTTVSGNTYLETQSIVAEDNNIDLNYNGTLETAIGGGLRVLHALGKDISAEMLTDSEGNWVTNNDFKSKALTIPLFTPSASDDVSGSEGNITRDDKYLYVKTATGWKRANLESF